MRLRAHLLITLIAVCLRPSFGILQWRPIQIVSKIFNRPLQNRLTGSMDLLTQCSSALRIRQPWNAPRWVWSFAWALQRNAIPLLHYFDRCAPKDSNLNLAVLWWKAISGNRLGSPTFDGFVAYDLLPPITRMIVGFPFCWLFPNLHHQNVALRTAFLDSSLQQVLEKNYRREHVDEDSSELDTNKSDEKIIPRVITLGAGFDTRSLRFRRSKSVGSSAVTTILSSEDDDKSAISQTPAANHYFDADFYEIDLPTVVFQKESIFKRFAVRRPDCVLPKLYGADLNDLSVVKSQLSEIFSLPEESLASGKKVKKPTVFIVEAVLMYLKEENVMPLLSLCMSEAAKYSSTVELCFADRLPGMPHSDTDVNVESAAARALLQTVGLDLTTWQPKPGRARHMGTAKYQIR